MVKDLKQPIQPFSDLIRCQRVGPNAIQIAKLLAKNAVSIWLSLHGRPRSSPRLFRVSYFSSIATPTCWPPHREFSIMARPRSDFFEYTSGRWM